ncbi:MAG: serine/threonine protein kinase [Actinoallomurus sp.]|jgi:serine/threonine protein kinase|nr:serine/threonine protein kinase [Actinoallomurus sp.]
MGSGDAGLEPLSQQDPLRVGGYLLLARLGTGAMGRVYLGRSASGRLVAVKTIRSEFAADGDFRTRFAHEVTAAGRVSGVYTAAVVAADPDAEIPWLATAYIPAPSLEQLVRACGPLPVEALRWLAAGCAEALESIHQAGLVHRDLKPSNVLVSADGPRVIDFGVARATERSTVTATHQAVGTPAYMAPEQARDSRQTVAASDVFSLGSTLLYAATGHPPYSGDSVTDVLVRLATEEPDLTGVPDEVADLVRECLQRDPDARPTAAALLAGLAEQLDEDGDYELRPAPLPADAVDLIEQYRQGKRPSTPVRAGEGGVADPTLDSPTSLGAPSRPPNLPRRPPAPAAPPRTPPRHGGSTRIILISAVALAVMAGALLLGMALGRTSGDPNRPPGPPPADFPPGNNGPPRVSGSSSIALSQNFGDGNTGFTVHGAGLTPGRKVTIQVDRGPVSPFTPVVDFGGVFSYVINQGHEFFAGKIPPGSHQVTVTVSGGRQTKLAFTVNTH